MCAVKTNVEVDSNPSNSSLLKPSSSSLGDSFKRTVVEELRQTAQAQAQTMMETALRECIASPQEQSELFVEVRSAIDKCLSVFEFKATKVAGADDEGVEEQCRILKGIFDKSIQKILRFNESILFVHLDSRLKEALSMFKTSFAESVWQHLPISEAQMRSAYDTTVENALQLVRAVPVADEEVENAVKSAGDVMELWFKRVAIENTAKLKASKAEWKLSETSMMEFFWMYFSYHLDAIRKTGDLITPSKIRAIFQCAKENAYIYAEKKGYDEATLRSSQKIEEGTEDLLQMELEAAECDAMLDVVRALKSAKIILLKAIYASEIDKVMAMLPISAESMREIHREMTKGSLADFISRPEQLSRASLNQACGVWEMDTNSIKMKEQEKLLLNDTAKMMATLEERNILLQLQEKLNARKHMNENEIARLHDTFEATSKVAAVAAEAAMFNVHDDNKAEIATNMSQAAADAAEKAKLNTPMMNISANNLEHKRVSGKMKKTMDESATPDELKVLLMRISHDLAEDEEPENKKKKVVGQYSGNSAALPPNEDEIENARNRSDDILGRTSCGGGKGGRDSRMQGARREAMKAREAREERSANAVIKVRKNGNEEIQGGAKAGKSRRMKAGQVAREGLALAKATATAAVVEEAEESHRKCGFGGIKRKRTTNFNSHATPPSKATEKRTGGRNPDNNTDNKGNVLQAAREAARKAICQQEEASIESVKKGKESHHKW